jgi:hypothetical protein
MAVNDGCVYGADTAQSAALNARGRS